MQLFDRAIDARGEPEVVRVDDESSAHVLTRVDWQREGQCGIGGQ